MLSWWNALFARPEPLPDFVDPVLGRCVPDQETGDFHVTVGSGDLEIELVLGRYRDDDEPDEDILEHARSIAADLPAFELRVRRFLEEQASYFDEPEIRDLITNLELESVSLTDALRPRDGMIFFVWEPDQPCWRCEYIQGECRSLGADT
jgi:hypothetical protein